MALAGQDDEDLRALGLGPAQQIRLGGMGKARGQASGSQAWRDLAQQGAVDVRRAQGFDSEFVPTPVGEDHLAGLRVHGTNEEPRLLDLDLATEVAHLDDVLGLF